MFYIELLFQSDMLYLIMLVKMNIDMKLISLLSSESQGQFLESIFKVKKKDRTEWISLTHLICIDFVFSVIQNLHAELNQACEMTC